MKTTITTLLLLFASSLLAKDIHVPGDYSKIQSAIDAAQDDDRIIVASGNYQEFLLINKSLTIIGTAPCTLYAGTKALSKAWNKKALINTSNNILTIKNINLVGIHTNNGKSKTAAATGNYCHVGIDSKDGLIELHNMNFNGFTKSYVKMDGGTLDLVESILSPQTSVHPVPPVGFVLDDVGGVTLKKVKCTNPKVQYLFAVNETYPGSRESFIMVKESELRNLIIDKGRKGSYSVYAKLTVDAPPVDKSPVVHIPDANFKKALLRYTKVDINKDKKIQVSEANALTGKIDCTSEGIVDFTGLEAFVSIDTLTCRYNDATTFSLKGNKNLKILNCNGMKLTSLDLSGNPLLEEIYCFSNKLTQLDLSKNPELNSLWCYNNQLVKIMTSNCLKLKSFICRNNSLAKLDLKNNNKLTYLDCSTNSLSEIDLSANKLLIMLSCYKNKLTTLNVRSNTNLTELSCGSNKLMKLDLATNSKLEILSCVRSKLKVVDVSSNKLLKELYCMEIGLTNLDVSANVNLITLKCRKNNLKNINTSKNTKLKGLFCQENQITDLDVSKNLDLRLLYCGKNKLTHIDVSSNMVLNEMDCSESADLMSVDMTKLTGKFDDLFAKKNPKLTCIKVDNVKYSNSTWDLRIDSHTLLSTTCNGNSAEETTHDSEGEGAEYDEGLANMTPPPSDFDEESEEGSEEGAEGEKGLSALAPPPSDVEEEDAKFSTSVKFDADRMQFSKKLKGEEIEFNLPSKLQYQSHVSNENTLAIAYRLTSSKDNYVGLWNDKLKYKAEYNFNKIKVLDFILEGEQSTEKSLVLIYYKDDAYKSSYVGLFDANMKYVGQYNVTGTENVTISFEKETPVVKYHINGKSWIVFLDRTGKELKTLSKKL